MQLRGAFILIIYEALSYMTTKSTMPKNFADLHCARSLPHVVVRCFLGRAWDSCTIRNDKILNEGSKSPQQGINEVR